MSNPVQGNQPRIYTQSTCRGCGGLKSTSEKYCSSCRAKGLGSNWAQTRQAATAKHKAEGTQDPYNTGAWKKLKLRVIQRDSALCRPCRSEGRITPYAEVDHVKPYHSHPELFFEIDNCVCICRDCHKTKTANDRKSKPDEGADSERDFSGIGVFESTRRR